MYIMSKARIMYAGSSGSNYGVNKNSPGNGNGKWQGLWPNVGHARNARLINTRAGGDNRNVVFCINQLGGVGRKSNMFATTADGMADCVSGPHGFADGNFGLLGSSETVAVSDVGLGLPWNADNSGDEVLTPTSLFVAWTGRPYYNVDTDYEVDLSVWNTFKDNVLVLPKELKDWGTTIGKGQGYVNSVFGGIENYRLAFVNLLTILPANSPGNAAQAGGSAPDSAIRISSQGADSCEENFYSFLFQNGNGLNSWHGGCFYDELPDFTKSGALELTETEKKLWTRFPIRVNRELEGVQPRPCGVAYDLSKGSVVPPCKNSMLCNKGIVLLFLRDKYNEWFRQQRAIGRTIENTFPELSAISLFNQPDGNVADSIEKSYNRMKTLNAKGPAGSPFVYAPEETVVPWCGANRPDIDPSACQWLAPDWKSGPLGAWGMPYDIPDPRVPSLAPPAPPPPRIISKGYTVTAYADSDCPCAAK